MKKLATLSLLALSLSACTQLQQSTERLPETSIIKKVVNAFSDNRQAATTTQTPNSSSQKRTKFNSFYDYLVSLSNGTAASEIDFQEFKTRGKQKKDRDFPEGYIHIGSRDEAGYVEFNHSSNFPEKYNSNNSEKTINAKFKDLKLEKVKLIRVITFRDKNGHPICAESIDPDGIGINSVWFEGAYEVMVENIKMYIFARHEGINRVANLVWRVVDGNTKLTCEKAQELASP